MTPSIPVRYNLWGPRSGDGLLCGTAAGITPANTYAWLTALTANTQRFDPLVVAPSALLQAWVSFIWTPKAVGSAIRLVSFDGGPANIAQIAEITGLTNTSPINSVVNVTTAIQALIDDSAEKFIGFQMKHDGVTAPHLYAVWVECVYAV